MISWPSKLESDLAADECDFTMLALFTAPDRRYQYQYGVYINVAARVRLNAHGS